MTMTNDFPVTSNSFGALSDDPRTAYGRGYRACTDGSENPYPAGTQLWKCWETGLWHAREDWA